MLFRAAVGFVLALSLFHGQALETRLRSPAIAAVRADILAQRPGAKLRVSIDVALRTIGRAIQNGTEPRRKGEELRARRLHSAG